MNNTFLGNVNPIGGYGIGVSSQLVGNNVNSVVMPQQKQENVSKNSLNFIADNGGCGHYRVIWPSFLLTAKEKYNIHTLNRIIPVEKFYDDLNVIRIQRQVSDEQLHVAKFLRQVCDKHNIRLCYEIDDIPLIEDIPDYNNHKFAYKKPSFRKNIEEIMNMCDEITVTNTFMRDYFRSKLQNQKVTVIPNFLPKFWIDRFYNEDKIKINFNKNKKKPRILYPGSAAHYDMTGKHADDVSAILNFVRKTVNEFQWVFFGGISPKLIDLVRNGKIEYHPFVDLMQYPQKMVDLKPQVIIAPLIPNNFNFSKSDIKFREGAALGVPTICQDIVTYSKSIYKFNKPSDLYSTIKELTKDAGVYMKASRKMREASKTYWLEDNIKCWEEFYLYRYDSSVRNELLKHQ